LTAPSKEWKLTELTVIERTIYALSMPQNIIVRLKGVPVPETVEADSIEQNGTWLELRKDENVVAKFKDSEVVGWVIEKR
jgi:hypothetical protein